MAARKLICIFYNLVDGTTANLVVTVLVVENLFRWALKNKIISIHIIFELFELFELLT